MMGITEQIVLVAGVAALAVVHVAVVAWVFDGVLGWFGRPRSVDLPRGLYHFADGKYEDGGLEWRPVDELFK